MKRKNRCPYCGRRISYAARFSSRRKAEYVCPRCGKESRVVINKTVILVFIICAILCIGVYFSMNGDPDARKQKRALRKQKGAM